MRVGRWLLAAAMVMAMVLAPRAVAMPLEATGDPLSIAGTEVLDLRFDGTLADTSPKAGAISMQKGTEGYGAGINGQAFNFSGSNAVKLGTASYLQPSNLTLSFWFKPNATMANEQVFAWSKAAYNVDGWYLSSESNATPLALSVGPSSGQPYKVAVDAPRGTFFPTGQWTHIVVSYDKVIKAVRFYRNGVRQTSTVKFATSASASGVLGSESTTVKTLGYNGPLYNGSHLNGLLDDYTLYDAVATTADVVSLTQRNDPTFDARTVAQADLNAIALPTIADTHFPVPTEGNAGTAITWTSSNPGAITIDGGNAVVTPPSSPVDVTLTATGTYGGSAPQAKTFTLKVQKPTTGEGAVYLLESGLESVNVNDAYLVNGNAKTVAYLLSLDPEKFLYSWYRQAGLTPTTTSGYGGWERATGTRFQGHFFGHYISALSQAYTTSTDTTQKAQLLAKLTAAVDGIKRAQDAYATLDPTNAGYVAPFPVTYLPSGADGLLVPFYNLHKVLAGLLEAYRYAPPSVSANALQVASKFGTWLNGWAGRQANPSALLGTEYGGMNEALYELYSITKSAQHKRAAEYFDETALFQRLAANQDVLDGLHANTTIPKLIGAMKRYTVFTEHPDLYATLTATEKANLGMYKAAAENFWQMVVNDHTYANGGNSQSEHFHGVDELYANATNGVTSGYGENSVSEICNEYNMLKLSRALFQVTKDVKYVDFYESTYINAILAQQNPETGMVTYFQPMTAGYAKVFGNALDEFWCDHGTGIESFTKLGDSVYFRDEESIWVNMFRSSVLTAGDVKLTQTADVPNSPDVKFEVEGGATTLRLRVPNWVDGAPTLTVNGQAKDVTPQGGYVAVAVKAGDEIGYRLPAKVTIDDSTENKHWVAFKYGPVLLATELNRNNVNATYVAGVLVRMSVADKSVSNNVIVSNATAFKQAIKDNLVRLPDGPNANGTMTMRFGLKNVDGVSEKLVFEPWYSLYDARYATYMTLVEPDSAAAQALILKGKEQQRVAETTIDSLTSFDNNNSEAGKNYKFNKSSVGVFNGQGFRDAQTAADAWFSYDMAVDPSKPKNYLGVRCYGGDNGRTFDVYVNDVLLKHERVTNAAGSNTWYVQYDEIPRSLLERRSTITVRFQSNGTSFVGGVFGVYTASTNAYDTKAELSKLTSNVGTFTADGVLRVPRGTTSVALDIDPATPSGLVYVDGILIDDTTPRTVTLTGDETNVTVKSYAQDHKTNATHALRIVRETGVDTGGGVGGAVPATLALTLGAAAEFAPFQPGVARDYTATTTAIVTSTAADAALSVSDPGHLSNGAFSLPEPLQVSMTPASWTGPVSNAQVGITLTQRIKASDALRTGRYAKTLTFTLSTTTP